MSFNFSELQQKADRVLHNADEFVRRYVQFALAPAQDVSVQYYDQSGNLQTATFPNRAKLVNQLIRPLPEAMVKEFYVNQNIQSDDGHDGTQTRPFKTLKKAIDNIPTGGGGLIKLQTDIDIGEEIWLSNKSIAITSDIPNQNVNLNIRCGYVSSQDVNDVKGKLNTGGASNIYFFRINFNFILENHNSSKGYSPYTQFISPLGSGFVNITFHTCTVNLSNLNYHFASAGFGAQGRVVSLHLYATTIRKNGNGMLIVNSPYSIHVDGGVSVVNASNQPIHIREVCGNILKVNGVPINILTNVADL